MNIKRNIFLGIVVLFVVAMCFMYLFEGNFVLNLVLLVSGLFLFVAIWIYNWPSNSTLLKVQCSTVLLLSLLGGMGAGPGILGQYSSFSEKVYATLIIIFCIFFAYYWLKLSFRVLVSILRIWKQDLEQKFK